MKPEIYFSQIREDSLVERTLQALHAPRRIAVIGSGGCTALSLLSDEAEAVYCVDLNPAQCALIELKKAAMANMDRPSYLAFIGEADSSDRLERYARLSGQLPAYARDFWDQHPQEIAMGINQCGATERFYRFISSNIRHNLYRDDLWQQLFDAPDLAAQIRFYEEYCTTAAWQTAIRLLLSKTTHLQFFPAFMFAQAKENDFGAFFAYQFEKELKSKPVANNYFLSQLLFGRYLYSQPEGLPYYLSEAGYAQAKRNLFKLQIVPDALQSFFRTVLGIDAYFLSNVFDWAQTAEREQICAGILHSKSAHAVLMYRNMLSTSALPPSFQQRFYIDEPRSRQLHAMERSMMYQSITVGEVR